MILLWTPPILKCITRSCVVYALCQTLKASLDLWYMCCTDGLNMHSKSKMFGTHPICCACENPQEGTCTRAPATSDLLQVYTLCAVGISSKCQICYTCMVERTCSHAKKRLGLLDIWKSWQTYIILDYNLSTKCVAGERHVWRNSTYVPLPAPSGNNTE